MTTDRAHFAETDRQRVNDAVAAAEQWTAAALLPVVAASSADYERSRGAAGLLAAMAAVALAEPLWEPPAPVLLVLLAAAYLTGSWLGRRSDALARALVPAAARRAAVERAAADALADRRLRRDDRDNALLLFVSLREATAVVTADRKVAEALEALGRDCLREVEADLTAAASRGDVAAGLARAVDSLAGPLAAALPRPATLIDELPHELVLRGAR